MGTWLREVKQAAQAHQDGTQQSMHLSPCQTSSLPISPQYSTQVYLQEAPGSGFSEWAQNAYAFKPQTTHPASSPRLLYPEARSASHSDHCQELRSHLHPSWREGRQSSRFIMSNSQPPGGGAPVMACSCSARSVLSCPAGPLALLFHTPHAQAHYNMMKPRAQRLSQQTDSTPKPRIHAGGVSTVDLT